MESTIKSLLIVFYLLSGHVSGQVLPIVWEADWYGTVDIWSGNVKKDSFPMSLKIDRLDSTWQFTIHYDRLATEQNIRAYELIVIDKEAYHLAIDEKNSILLDTYFIDDCLYSRFKVMTSDIQTKICLVDDVLHYDIVSYRTQEVRFSGGGVIDQDTMPKVLSFKPYQVMKAQLYKKK